jgi:uncharacterized membrane protein YdbT with pleckstrin-like domain
VFDSRLGGADPAVLKLVAGLVLLALIVFFAAWSLKSKTTRLIVTEERTILRRGLLSRQTTEVQHEDVRSVQVNQSLLQRILNVGTVAIGSAGHSGMEVEIGGIVSPQEVAALIRERQ